ncbi:MAG: ATP-binding protein [Magnetococcales bacterium]|nr:ATP-binding protein [Magnetococcales bacterium]
MVEKILADATPEKRLFVSLITRDISLVDAFLDIIDNSINAALEPLAAKLKTADDYQTLLKSNVKPKVQIDVTVSSARLVVEDNATGISAKIAADHVFKFGRALGDAEKSDRLSVYGIGLKRAMFKCGNKINMISNHKDGGFELKLNVQDWARLKQDKWSFEIEKRAPEQSKHGTRIVISELHDDVRRRLEDGIFLDQLREKIARTYSVFIGRIVDITLNNQAIPQESFDIGGNYANEKFKSGKVSCNITAGIAAVSGGAFRDKNAGWYVFCNGRAVLFADKSTTTGWAGGGLPIFQPKHRPFLGTVFFVSEDPEALPWTTTKGDVNEENAVWQEAKRHMITVGRIVIGFLDNRYTEDGTEVAPSELREAAGSKVSVLDAATAKKRTFKPPKAAGLKTIKIQYEARVKDVERIEKHLRNPGMGGSKIGKYTFDYYLKNEVGGDD